MALDHGTKVLEAARLALCEAGLLDASAPFPHFAARMSGNFIFLAFTGGSGFYLVKVGVLTELDREYAGLRAGHAAFPDSVPQPLSLSRHRGFATLVTKGLRFAPIGARTLRRPPPGFAKAMSEYFATSARAFVTATEVAHSARIHNALQPVGAPVPPGVWHDYVDSIATEVDRLPGISQHGDFYLENLGWGDRGIAILDWEDFGREQLPGTDLALLLLSSNEWSVTRLAAAVRECGPHAWLFAAGCAGIGLPQSLFLRLLPAYILLLARMKDEQGYGDEFRRRALSALSEALLQTADPVNAGAGP